MHDYIEAAVAWRAVEDRIMKNRLKEPATMKAIKARTDEMVWQVLKGTRLGNYVKDKRRTIKLTYGMNAMYLRHFLRNAQPSKYFEGKNWIITRRSRPQHTHPH